jgi:hypothetical protein
VAGDGAGDRRCVVSAAHKMASTSAISAFTSGSRNRISHSISLMVSSVAGIPIRSSGVIIARPVPVSTRRSGVDDLASMVVSSVAADRDLAGLGLLGHRNP